MLFDADEHTGKFGGVRAFLKNVQPLPDAAVLGYPGNETLTIGARGFLRAELHVFGKAAHSGTSKRKGVSAIAKIARLISAVDEAPLPPAQDGPFSFGASATVTSIEGGHGFSQVPDHAACNIDIRLTPYFAEGDAQSWLEAIVKSVDASHPSPRATMIRQIDHWPAYLVDAQHPLVVAFQQGGYDAFNRHVPTAVCGPSNIGNFLAAHQIPTLCGLGVSYGNLHGTDEFADLSTVPQVYSAYYKATQNFLRSFSHSDEKRRRLAASF